MKYLKRTPLLTAMQSSITKKNELAKLLIRSGADVNISDGVYTPLIMAIKNMDTETVKLIIDAGANVNARDKHGNDALSVAANEKVKKMLNSNR